MKTFLNQLLLWKRFWKSVDKELIDNLGPNGFSRIVLSFSFLVSRLQSGFLYHYVRYNNRSYITN